MNKKILLIVILFLIIIVITSLVVGYALYYKNSLKNTHNELEQAEAANDSNTSIDNNITSSSKDSNDEINQNQIEEQQAESKDADIEDIITYMPDMTKVSQEVGDMFTALSESVIQMQGDNTPLNNNILSIAFGVENISPETLTVYYHKPTLTAYVIINDSYICKSYYNFQDNYLSYYCDYTLVTLDEIIKNCEKIIETSDQDKLNDILFGYRPLKDYIDQN